MKISVLGCSGGIGAGVETTSFLIDDDILLDAGSGVGSLTIEQMTGIRHIFITHSHLDHVSFIPLLVDTIFDRIDTPIVIHGQEATLKVLKEHIFNWVVWPDFAELPHPDKPVLAYQVIEPGEKVLVNGKTFHAIPVNHVIPAMAYVVEKNGKVFAFSGDTTSNDSLWEGLNSYERLDLLFIECAFANHDLQLSQLARHYCPSLLSADLQKLRHKPNVCISHLKPGEEDTIMSEISSAMPDRNVQRLQGGQVFEL
jgi:ribonuclease BN (tRNA processing enzyme)